jgi:aryl-alcohol dehydrogenase
VKIQAAVLRDGAAPYTIEDVELAEPGHDEVRVRIVGSGMCHTDVLPRGGMAALPMITGHEGAGVVDAIGPGVTTLAVGDHVVLSFDSCGTCENCTKGQRAYCATFLPRNLTGRNLDGSTSVVDADGKEVAARWFGQSSLATHCIASTRNAVKVDADLPIELFGPLGCGIQTGAGSILLAMQVKPDSSLVVFGSGAVGLAAVMAGVVAGATTIIAVDLHQSRLDLAQELGATHALRGDDPQLLAQIQAITGGGAQYSFDTTGIPAVMQTAVACLRMTGVCGYVGVQIGNIEFDGFALVGKTVIGILEGSADPHSFIPHMIDLWRAGRFPFDRLITTYRLDQVNEAEQSSLSGGAIKPVLLL